MVACEEFAAMPTVRCIDDALEVRLTHAVGDGLSIELLLHRIHDSVRCTFMLIVMRIELRLIYVFGLDYTRYCAIRYNM